MKISDIDQHAQGGVRRHINGDEVKNARVGKKRHSGSQGRMTLGERTRQHQKITHSHLDTRAI